MRLIIMENILVRRPAQLFSEGSARSAIAMEVMGLWHLSQPIGTGWPNQMSP